LPENWLMPKDKELLKGGGGGGGGANCHDMPT
jgi:hypothetical protein